MKITIIGTSSAVPLPNRNLSATLAQIEGEYVLFDCGEGTQFHLRKLGIATGKIKTICITHLHGDHSFGLLGLISSLTFTNKNQKLMIIGPRGIKELIDVSMKNQQFNLEFPLNIIELDELLEPKTVFESDDFNISAVSLDHRVPAFGFRLQKQDKPGHINLEKINELKVEVGPKLAELKHGNSVISEDGKMITPEMVLGGKIKGESFCYVTDTRYCKRSVLLADHCDVLMHEATYLSDLEEKATENGHSTAKQAAMVAKEAQVKQLVLFHYSSRYTKTEHHFKEAANIFPNTITAKDFDEIIIKERA